MTELWRRITILFMAIMLGIGALAVLPGCKKKGPLEKAGEKADKAVEDAGEAVEDATQ